MMKNIRTTRQQLKEILTHSDTLSTSENGDLLIDKVAARDLIDEFGSPLFVFSEKTLRGNFRRIRSAFEKAWPQPVNIMYAIKSNTNFALRAILHQEGAGGDCFGMGEIEATFLAGANPDKIVLNSSFKSLEAMRRAVGLGVRVVLEDEQDIDDLEKIAATLNRKTVVAIRLKVVPEAFKEFESDQYLISGDGRPKYFRSKWGVTEERALQMINRILSSSSLSLDGYHAHFGRISSNPLYMVAWQEEYVRMIVSLYKKTNFAPRIVDIGGGWPRERDPESRSLAMNKHPIETYVNEVSNILLKYFQDADMPIPQLWVEPGRYISGNTGILLTTVGLIKRDAGFVIVNVDASTNILRDHFAYTILAAEGMQRPCTLTADIVGPTCIPSILGQDRPMPDLRRGEILAVLDAGCYAESYANHLNSIPLPAAVLINDGKVDLIRKAETIEYMFANQVIPERLKASKVNA